jgi:hypothetical protein
MNRRLAAAALALVVASAVASAVAAGPLGSGPDTADRATPTGADAPALHAQHGGPNASNATVPPGARLSGAVGVGRAEAEGAVQRRALGLEIARAATADAKARVVANRTVALQTRLEALSERRDRLREARRNGSIGEGQYRARAAVLAVEAASARAIADDTHRAAADVPADARRDHGVNVTAIRRLRRDAGNLTGPEVAWIAQSIAGPNVTRGPSGGAGPPAGAGPPDDRRGSGGSEPPADAGRSNGTAPDDANRSPADGARDDGRGEGGNRDGDATDDDADGGGGDENASGSDESPDGADEGRGDGGPGDGSGSSGSDSGGGGGGGSSDGGAGGGGADAGGRGGSNAGNGGR